MEMLVFFVPIRPVSWNKIATSHWRVYKKYKDLLAQATWIACKQANVKPIKGPVKIDVVAHWKDKRVHDVSNIFIKSCEDQLVKDGIIEGDDCSIVKSVTFSGLLAQKEEGLTVMIEKLA